jgi:CO/xanthine dehydrogenase FAD-binding subunit
MILPRFDVLVPDTPADACRMLEECAAKGVRILAGGTDLLVDLKKPIIPQHVPRCGGCAEHPRGRIRTTIDCSSWSAAASLANAGGSLRAWSQDEGRASPKCLVSLHRLHELRGIRLLADGSLRIGALTTITEIARSAEVRRFWTALAEGADNLGSPLVRNRATLGGNIANARPAADMAAATIALGGILTLQGRGGKRFLPAEIFPTSPGFSVIQPDEILTFITYPPPRACSGSVYYKLANRKALEIATVGASVWLSLEAPGGPILDARVALGAVAPTPVLSESARQILLGKVPGEPDFQAAARAAREHARPIDDHRGSAWYRLQMVELLTLRLLKIAFRRAGGAE